MHRTSKFLLIFLTLLLALYGSLRFLLPYFIKPQIENTLSQQMTSEVKIESLTFNPLSLEVKLGSIYLSDGQLVKSIYTDLSLNDIFNRRIIVSHLLIKGLNFELIKKDKTLKLKGLKTYPQTDSVTEDGGGFNWNLTLKKATISDVNIGFPSNKNLSIQELIINDLHSFESNEKASFRGLFLVEGNRVELDGEALNYHDSPILRAHIEISDFNLDFFNTFDLETFGKIEGKLSTNSNIELKNNELEINTNLSLTNFSLYSKGGEMVEYFVKSLKLKEGSATIRKKEITTSIKTLETENFILSIPSEVLKVQKHLSKFAKIQVSNIRYEQLSTPKGLLINLRALYNNEAPIKASQKIKGEKKELRVNIQGMDLSPFSETLEQSIAHQIKSGKLSLKMRTVSERKKVHGKVNVKLDQFHLDNQSERGRDIASKSMIPLKTAVSMIRDDKGSIHFELDISGSEEDPNFGFLPIIKSGIGSFLISKLTTIIATRAAIEFFPLLISSVPFSPTNAFMLARGGYKFVTKPRFKNIEFSAQGTEIAETSEDLLKELAIFLKENEEMRLQLCPVASTHESTQSKKGPSLSETQALNLANKRIEKMKDFLGESKAKPSQVIFCRPKISSQQIQTGKLQISL